MTTLTLDRLKSHDTQLVQDPADRATMRQVDAEVSETNYLHAKRLEWHLAMIRCAQDPLDMVRILSDIADPLPNVYLRTAHDEIMRRRAVRQRNIAVTTNGGEAAMQH